MMNKENDHNLIKSAYLIGALLLVIGVISSATLLFNKERGDVANEADRSGTNGTNLSKEEKRQIEESVSGGAAPINALLEEEKKKIEANFNNPSAVHERFDEGERIKY